MGKRFWMAVLLLVCAAGAFAAGPAAVRKQVESSLLVKGTIDIDASGAVVGHALERREDLPSGIAEMIAKVVPQWRFEPVALKDGTTRARADMSLRIVAKKLDDDSFTVRISGAQFGQDRPGESPSARDRLDPPRYPPAAVRAGVGGTVYMALKIGRDGLVEEAIAEQVNLRLVTNERAMQQWRDVLARAALQTAKKWLFHPPTRGDEIEAPHWSVRVPVDFSLDHQRSAFEHGWQAYVPGPRQSIPWRPEEADAGADALVAGGVYPLDGGPRLLTPLDQS